METRYLRVAGLKRSGNHGIMNWILGLHPGRFYFHNDHCGDFAAKELLRLTSSHLKLGETHPDYIPVNKDEEKQLVIVSFEDKNPDKVFLDDLVPHYKEYYGADNYKHVLVIRDPYNMGASRFKREPMTEHWLRYPIIKGKHEELINLWKQYAYLFLEKENDPNWLCVSYNRWFKDINYRKQLAAKLGRPFTDIGLRGSMLLSTPGKSSFETHDDTQAYDVEGRWQYFIRHPKYRMFIQDEEMRQLSKTITGFTLPGRGCKRVLKPMKSTERVIRL